MLLRTYAGGVHLNSFIKCFLCSITVQIFVLIASKQVIIAPPVSWSIILCGSILIFRIAPVDNVNKELEKEEKIYCKKISMKIDITSCNQICFYGNIGYIFYVIFFLDGVFHIEYAATS